jgi:hypothetical protein
MQRAALRSVLVAVLIAGGLGWLHAWGVGLWLLLALGVVVAFIAWALPHMGVRLLDDIILFVRGRFWAREQGRFHSFGGVPLRIEDDGLHMWVDGEGLMRAQGRREPEAALAARHAGNWQRWEDGTLMLRVDAVVNHLATMPGRDDPRAQRLRRYFEREVLFPAAERRRRARRA